MGDIDASGSGVIGNNVTVKATGKIKGLFYGNNVDLSAQKGIEGNGVARDNLTVSSSDGPIVGKWISGDTANVSGPEIIGDVLGKDVVTTGDVSGQKGFAQGTAANATSQSLQNDEQGKTLAAAKTDEELGQFKGQPGPKLAKTVGRVTVILPSKLN